MANTLRHDISRVIRWMLAMPMLSIWPFLSFAPFFALFAEDNSGTEIVVYIVFLARSALGAISLWIGFALTAHPHVNKSTRVAITSAAPKIAVYAAVWTVAFIGYRFYLWIFNQSSCLSVVTVAGGSHADSLPQKAWATGVGQKQTSGP